MKGSPREMIRRNVLSAALAGGAVLIAGCLGSADDSPPADATTAVEVTTVGSFGAEVPIEATVDVVYPWATGDRPPAIEITLENQSDRRFELVAGGGAWRVLSDRASEQVEPGVALLGEDVDADRAPTPDEPDGCWKSTGGTGNPLRVRNLTELDPRGSRSMQFEVWGHHGNADDACLPTGEFTFSDSYTAENDPDVAFEWEFGIRIEDVE